jgi:hypothetical protein
VKPQRPSPEIKTLLQMPTYIHSQHTKNTHRHPFNTEYMQEKLLFYIKMENACIYKVFLSTACNKVSALLFCSLLTDSTSHPLPSYLLLNEILKSLLPEGALRALPSNLPTLFNYIEWVV